MNECLDGQDTNACKYFFTDKASYSFLCICNSPDISVNNL